MNDFETPRPVAPVSRSGLAAQPPGGPGPAAGDSHPPAAGPDYRIEAKTPGRDWRFLGTERDDISRREYGMSAERLAHIVTDRLTAEYPDWEFRAVPCEVTR